MLLLIDAGNTRVKWALADERTSAAPGQWAAAGMVEHARLQELAAAWAGLTAARVIVSNVAGSAMRAALEQLLRQALRVDAQHIEWFASSPQRAGLRNAYRDPGQLGCDRFAAAIGANALYPGQALLVATCGTATTIDAIGAGGVFIGGMILPGLGLMASALARNTAQLSPLPQIAHDVDVADPFADHTDAAITSGCLSAQAGAIERAFAALERREGSVQCLLSGGAAALISSHLACPHAAVENLVLIGLQAAAAHPPT
jgi:type III pantothenate kinase